MAHTLFHDISEHQASYDMDNDQNPIIFMRMSYFGYGSKTGYFDKYAARNYNNAIRLGKVPGLYHFAGGADPIAEADYFIDACSPLADGDILILDYELTADMNPPADPSEWSWQFVNRIHERTGTWPLFYTYTSMLQQYGFKKVLEKCGLWLADYRFSPEDDIPGVPPYIIHQFQGSPLDTNACFLSLDTLKKYSYRSPNSTPPAPELPPAQPDIPDTQPVPQPEPPVPAPTPEDDTNAVVKENNALLKQILSLIQSIYDYFKGQYKTFSKYIKK